MSQETINQASGPSAQVILTEKSFCWRALIAFKAGYLLFVVCLVWLLPLMNQGAFFAVHQRWPRTGGPTFGSYFATWDAAHYLFLSEVGYERWASSCAFYPLLPFLTRAFSFLTGGSHLLAGLIICNVASVLAFCLFHRLVTERFDRPTATLALVLLLMYPGALFFQFIYTESLFFLLLMMLWWSLERKSFGIIYAVGFFLPLARPVGIFCLAPILWHLWSRQIPRRDWWCALGPLAGFACYFLLMGALTGNAFEGFDAQKQLGTNSITNLFDIPKFFAELFNPTTLHDYRGSLLDRSLFVLLFAFIPLLWKMERTWFWWAVTLGLLPAMIATFTSFTRYLVLIFPFFIALAVLLRNPKLWIARVFVLSAFGGLQFWLLLRHINFEWAG